MEQFEIEMAFSFSVSLSDSTKSPLDSLLYQAMNNALSNWSNYIAGVGTLVVQLSVETLGSLILANGGPTSWRSASTAANGSTLRQPSSVYELTTGNHLASSDININFNSAYLSTSYVTLPYLTAVFEHELGHGFGINGYRGATGTLGFYQSNFDTLSSYNAAAGTDYFTGAAAEHVYGGPVPLTSLPTSNPISAENFYHLGATGSSADPASLINDVMYGGGIASSSPAISALDVAIMLDTGVPLSSAGFALLGVDPNAPAQVAALYTSILGRAAAASEIASWEQALADGSNLTAIRAYVANSQEAAADIQAVYQAVLGRAASAADVTAYQAAFAAGAPLAAVRANLASSAEAATDVQATYQAVAGHGASAADLAFYQAAFAAGAPLSSVRANLAGSVEVATDVQAAYQAVLGRSAPATDIAFYQKAFAAGASLSAVRINLSSSAEVANDVQAAYQAVLGHAASAADIAFYRSAFAAGAPLSAVRANLASSAEVASDVQATYQAVAGHAASAADIAFYRSAFAAGAPLSAVRSNLAGSVEVASDVQAAYQAVLGRSASAVDVGFYQAAFAAGAPLSAVRANLSSSFEAVNDIGAVYQYELGTPAGAADVAFWQGAYKIGSALSAIPGLLAISDAATAGINNAYQVLLYRPPTAADLAFWRGALAAGSSLTAITPLLANTAESKGVVAGFYQVGYADAASLAGGSPVASDPSSTIGITSESSSYGATTQFAFDTYGNLAMVPIGATQADIALTNTGEPGNVTGFAAAPDFIVVPKADTTSFTTPPNFTVTDGATMAMIGSNAIQLDAVSPSQLTAASLHFV